jgi:hypothetical protein
MKLRLNVALAAVLAVVLLPAGAAGDAPLCTYGVSSVGPVTLVHGRLSGDMRPHTYACLR